jgi:hypothetical protein
MNPTLVKRIKSPKAPADVTPVTVDFRAALGTIDGDVLNVTMPVILSSIRNDDVTTDLVFVPPAQFSTDATRVTCWFAAGTAVVEYLVSITAQSMLGQTLERSFILPVYYR